MLYEPEQVIEAVDRHWGDRRRKLLLSPVNGSHSSSWATDIQKQIKAIELVLREHFVSSPDQHGDPATLRERRRSIQVAIRKASHWPYEKALPLFVSEWFVTSILEPHQLQRFVKEERDYIGEHVIPLEYSLPSRLVLTDPSQYIAQIGKAITTPMCKLIGYEDRRILRLRHMNVDLPFKRYSEPYRGEPIVVYRTTDGQYIEPDTYDWDSWRNDMQAVPLYREGLKISERFAERWTEMLDPVIVQRMVDLNILQDRLAEREEFSSQKIGIGRRKEELDIIEASLLQTLEAVEVPLTHHGFPRLRIPARCSRVSLILRGQDGKDLLTLTIGPERRKLDLYHCSEGNGAHAVEGRQMVPLVRAALLRLFPNTLLAPLPQSFPKSSSGYRILYGAAPTVETTVDLARQCIKAMLCVCRNEAGPAA